MKLWKTKDWCIKCELCFVWKFSPKPRTYLIIFHCDEQFTCYTLQHRLLHVCATRDAHATHSKEQRGCCAFVSSHIISITCQSCSTSKAEAGREKVKWTKEKPSQAKAKQVAVKTAERNSFLHSSLPHKHTPCVCCLALFACLWTSNVLDVACMYF